MGLYAAPGPIYYRLHTILYSILSVRSAKKSLLYTIRQLLHTIYNTINYTIRAKRKEIFEPIWSSGTTSFGSTSPRVHGSTKFISYYLREPPGRALPLNMNRGAKMRILSHTTSASLPATLPILLLTRDHGSTGPRDHGPGNPRLCYKCSFQNIIEDPTDKLFREHYIIF